MAEKGATKYPVKRDENRRVLTRGSLELFARFYFPHILTDDVPAFHRELYDLFVPGEGKPRVLRCLDIEPRAHGKSKRWSIIYPTWVILTDPYNIGYRNIDFMLISATASRSEDFLREIGSELSGNALLRADWGSQLIKAERDNSTDKILNNGARIRAKGAGAQVRGDHPSDIVIDDLEDSEEAQNPELRDKLFKWFTEDLYGTLLENSSMFLVGTIVHPESLLSKLWESSPMTEGWTKRRYSAIKEDGSALWPTKWSIERLDKRRAEIGELAFSQEYLNQPLPSENPTIRPEWIQYYERIPIDRRQLYRVVSVDPAFSEKRESDYTAIVSLGLCTSGDHAKNIWVLDASRGHWSPKETTKKIVDECLRIAADEIVIEAVAGAVMYADQLRTELNRRNLFDVQIKQVTPHANKLKKGEKMDKLTRLQSTATLFQEKYIFFPKHLRWLVDEILMMPHGTHDDGADALAWGLRHIMKGELRRVGRRYKADPRPMVALANSGGY